MNNLIDISRDFPITIFLSGVMFTAFCASGLFFIKFWKRTNERFFLYFGWACWMLAFDRVPLLWLTIRHKEHEFAYLFRVVSFVLIIYAFIKANKSKSAGT